MGGWVLVEPSVTRALGMPWLETPVGWSMAHLVAGVVTGAIFAAVVIVMGFPGTAPAMRTAGGPAVPATARPERA